MTTYAVQGPPHQGATVALAAPGGVTGDLAVTGQGLALLVVNNGGTAITVTLPVATPVDSNLVVASRTVSVPALAASIPGMSLIPVPSSVYGVGTTAVQYSTVAQVTVAEITIP